ncbi:serine-threonine protein kinase [Streptomyces antimicrobicus]|uniref:Serine-threonine protein kinase n=1 Tax=Streptomyces antimicrobicus TaxID=2883108 RepID=A0ABS8BE24_9ACTN|nr:serine-threonine protein kinase [Streptomyces antimicrobicus]MCB5182784.1 serine-threonine protein kinase [Streptomyces antimicrobicus]
MGVGPYVELTFDAQGDVDRASRDAVGRLDVTDLLVFAHGWNSDRSTATRLYERFFAPFPRLVGPGVRLGYVGVVWPSMRFSDEPIPDFDPPGLRPGPADGSPALDSGTRRALGAFWPGREAELDRVAQLLSERPESVAAFAEFGALVRELAGVDEAASWPRSPAGTAAAATAEAEAGTAVAYAEEGAVDVPAMFTADVLEVCRVFADALAEAGGTVADGGAAPDGGVRELSPGGGLRRLWNGGKEVLRQAAYYEMKKRAGVVGERGLGPALVELSRSRPELRVHLVGHSFGARVVSFALRAVPDGWGFVKSLTLLQGAFSHYAFSERLPHDRGRGGALRGVQRRVDGPVVACHSDRDTALKVFYPLASRMAGDSAGFAGFDARWGAIGHDGVQALPGAPRLTLDAALREGLPGAGCVSVDAASVVRRGGAPSGAHSDICHEELARLVVSAGRMWR